MPTRVIYAFSIPIIVSTLLVGKPKPVDIPAEVAEDDVTNG